MAPKAIAVAGRIGEVRRDVGVEHFGQTGRIGELYRHFGLSVGTIVQAAGEPTPGSRASDMRFSSQSAVSSSTAKCRAATFFVGVFGKPANHPKRTCLGPRFRRVRVPHRWLKTRISRF